MIKRVTKKTILEGAKLCQIKGYWSDEVREYLDEFSSTARNKIDSILYSEYVSVNTKQSFTLFSSNPFSKSKSWYIELVFTLTYWLYFI